jgi:hypothetical protein
LPSIAGLSFQNTKLAINDGFFDIATDFTYKPSLSVYDRQALDEANTEWLQQFKAGYWPTPDAIDITTGASDDDNDMVEDVPQVVPV